MSDAPEIQEIYISRESIPGDDGSLLVCRTTSGIHHRVFDILPPVPGIEYPEDADFDEFVRQFGYKKVEAIRRGRLYFLVEENEKKETVREPVSELEAARI